MFKAECCTFPSQTWNRAIVQAVDVLQRKAHVLYIDYGNEEMIPIDSVHPLSRGLDLFPPSVSPFFVNSCQRPRCPPGSLAASVDGYPEAGSPVVRL